MATQDAEIQQIFLEEAQQILADSEDAFLTLDSGDVSPENWDRILRLVHNFKGSARATGFPVLSHVAHIAEDQLLAIRKGQIPLEKRVTGVMLQFLDFLKRYIEGLKANLEFALDTNEIESLMKGLSNVTPATAAIPEAVTPAESAPQSISVADSTTLAELDAVLAAQSEPQVTAPKAPAPQAAAPAQASSPANKASEDSIRIATSKLDELINLIGEVVVNQTVLNQHVSSETTGSEHAVQTIRYTAKIVGDLQDLAMSLRMQPIRPTFQKLRRAIRDVADAQGKNVDIVIEGEHVELDKTILDQIGDPLTHLVRNAVDHGLETDEARKSVGKTETARVQLSATTKESSILISVADNGKGLNREVLIQKALKMKLISPDQKLSDQQAYELIFKPGFSTKEVVTDVSGRGVGMDVVHKAVDALKGSVSIASVLGKGTTFTISLPLSLSIINGLLVSVDSKKYIVPVSQLLETIEYSKVRVETCTSKGRIFNLRGDVIPVLSLQQILHGSRKASAGKDLPYGLISFFKGRKVSFEIDEIVGQQQIVLKRLGREMQGIPGVVGGAILGTGEPALVLNLYEFFEQRSTPYAA